MDEKLYFLAYHKHGRPQHLVAGPFVSMPLAQGALNTHPLRDRLVIVSTTLHFQQES
jgi:hypothetical protein